MKSKLLVMIITLSISTIFIIPNVGVAYGLSAESLKTLDAAYQNYVCCCASHQIKHKVCRKCYRSI